MLNYFNSTLYFPQHNKQKTINTLSSYTIYIIVEQVKTVCYTEIVLFTLINSLYNIYLFIYTNGVAMCSLFLYKEHPVVGRG